MGPALKRKFVIKGRNKDRTRKAQTLRFCESRPKLTDPGIHIALILIEDSMDCTLGVALDCLGIALDFLRKTASKKLPNRLECLIETQSHLTIFVQVIFENF
jgi:hypothetical protein